MFKEIPADPLSISKRKLVCGVGVNDAPYRVNPVINGKRYKCPIYSIWLSMIQRCYSKQFHLKNRSYSDCEVHSDWHTFTNFYKWCVQQDYKGKALDKDIVNPGSKVYCEDNCRFVSKRVNCAIIDSDLQQRTLPKGVYFDEERKKFRARIKINGKIKTLGSFDDPVSAARAFAVAKKDKLLKLSESEQDKDIKLGILKHAELAIEQFKGAA